MKQGITMPKLLLMLAEVIAFALLAVVSSSHFGLADGLRITVAYLIAYLVPQIVLSRAKATSTTAHVILFVLSVFLMAVSYINLLEWTSVEDYSLAIPNLQNDARTYYKWALHYYDGRVEYQKVAFPGFPMIILGMWRLLGLSVIWPQAMNIMFTLTAVVLTGMTTRRLLVNRCSLDAGTLLNCGMAMTLLLSYYLMSGISMLKEGSVFLSVSLAGFSLASMTAADEERRHLSRDIVIFALACVIMSFIRTTFIYFILLGVLLMVLPHWRRDWGMALGMVAIALITLYLGNSLAFYSFDQHARIIKGGWSMQQVYVDGSINQNFRKVIGYYFLYSPWHKLFILPVTTGLQFIIPFPWPNLHESVDLFNWLSRFSYGWYLVGGITLFYYLFMMWKRHSNMGIWPLWPAISFIIIAYIVAGSVVRYTLPFEPLMIPVALYVLCKLREGLWRKPFKRWSIFYIILLMVTLLTCLEIQKMSISTMLHTLPLAHYLKYYLPYI